MIDYLLPLQTTFEANANTADAAPMKKYMRDLLTQLQNS